MDYGQSSYQSMIHPLLKNATHQELLNSSPVYQALYSSRGDQLLKNASHDDLLSGSKLYRDIWQAKIVLEVELQAEK
jgi:hypothetical protein